MALKTKVKINRITNLTDARYCSGMYVDVLGFSLEEGSPHYVSPSQFQEITGWISGADYAAEFTGSDAYTIERKLADYPGINWIESCDLDTLIQLKNLGKELIYQVSMEEIESIVPKKWAVEENYREAAAYDFQNQLLGIPDMHKAGFTGKGVTVAIFDSGFPGLDKASAFSHLFTNKQVLGQLNVVRPWIKEVFRDNEHGTQVASLIVANQAETLVSGAHQAQVIFAITEDVATEYPVEELNWVRAAEYADSLGVDIINSSLGYLDFDEPKLTYTTAQLDGKTTYVSRGASLAAKRGILIVNSVGNYGSAGSSSLVAPADAAGILAVGSVTASSTVSAFSSRGPTADGRIKPELVAFGQSPVLIRASGQVSAAAGTSFSSPQIAALAAGLWEAKPTWTKDELLTNLIKSGTQYATPDQNLGYGIPNFRGAFYGALLGINDEEEVGWTVYPNPVTDGQVYIRFGQELSFQIQLFDSSGRPVLEKMLQRNSTKDPYFLTLNQLPSGLYFMQLMDGKEIAYQKLIKQ